MEAELIQWLGEHLPVRDGIRVGVGDDAAVLDGSLGTVVTTDMLTDGVDFRLEEVDPRLVGRKALGVNLSDLAAMAARPLAAFVSLVLPRAGVAPATGREPYTALQLAIELYQGMLPLAERFGLTIAGGDTNTWDAPLAISITAVGTTTPRGPLTRRGARVGDQLLATGEFGGSLLAKHLEVEPRVAEALLLHERYALHAAIDVSDGLALDVSRLATASGVGAQLDCASIPLSQAAHQRSQQSGRSALEHALGDGEDFELVVAVAPEVAERLLADQPLSIPLTRIGEIVPAAGLWQRNADGQSTALQPSGYLH